MHLIRVGLLLIYIFSWIVEFYDLVKHTSLFELVKIVRKNADGDIYYTKKAL